MRYIIRQRSRMPVSVRYYSELKGICIGQCVDKTRTYKNGSAFDNAYAHAHVSPSDQYSGWICMEYKYQLKDKLGLLHEVAHLIANKSSSYGFHGKRWRKVVKEIGGTYKPYVFRHEHNVDLSKEPGA